MNERIASDPAGNPHIVGSLSSAAGSGVVRLEGRYRAEIGEVWSALTDPVRLAQWHAKVEGDLRPGGTYRRTVESDGWSGGGRIEACEPPRHLRVTSRESDESFEAGDGASPFDAIIEATLTKDGDATLLIAEISGMPLDVIEFFGVGWQLHAERLAAFLSGAEAPDAERRWAELLPGYQRLAAQLR